MQIVGVLCSRMSLGEPPTRTTTAATGCWSALLGTSAHQACDDSRVTVAASPRCMQPGRPAVDIFGLLRRATLWRRRRHPLRLHGSNSKSNVFGFMHLPIAAMIRAVVRLPRDRSRWNIVLCLPGQPFPLRTSYPLMSVRIFAGASAHSCVCAVSNSAFVRST